MSPQQLAQLIECRNSGQISDRQWQQHLAETPGLITRNGGNVITNGRALPPRVIHTTSSWSHIWRAAVWLSIAVIFVVLAAGCGLYAVRFFI